MKDNAPCEHVVMPFSCIPPTTQDWLIWHAIESHQLWWRQTKRWLLWLKHAMGIDIDIFSFTHKFWFWRMSSILLLREHAMCLCFGFPRALYSFVFDLSAFTKHLTLALGHALIRQFMKSRWDAHSTADWRGHPLALQLVVTRIMSAIQMLWVSATAASCWSVGHMVLSYALC